MYSGILTFYLASSLKFSSGILSARVQGQHTASGVHDMGAAHSEGNEVRARRSPQRPELAI